MSGSVPYVCQRCGAKYEEAEVRRDGRCTVQGDGGAVCNGRIARWSLPEEARRTAEPMGFSAAAIAQAKEMAARLLSRSEFIRGGVFPDGSSTAVLHFKTADDRAEFANCVVTLGGRIGA